MITKEEWQAKMQGYYEANERTRAMAIDRASCVAFEYGTVWDWDDNISSQWGQELCDKWDIKPDPARLLGGERYGIRTR